MSNVILRVRTTAVRVIVRAAQGASGVDNPRAAFETNKASIVDNDRIAILDSANSNLPKHTLWSLIKSTLKAYFDSLYHTLGGALGTPASGDLTNCTFPTLNQNTTGNAATVTTINGRISAGANISISGSGTAPSPYVLSGSSSAWVDITGKPVEVTSLSGTNTGDETASTIKSKLGISTLSGSNTGDQTDISGNAATVTTINGKISAGTNVTIAGDGTAASPYVVSSTGGDGGGSEIVISETAPVDLTKGWLDPTDGILAYYVGGGWVTQGSVSGTTILDGVLTLSGKALTLNGKVLTFTS